MNKVPTIYELRQRGFKVRVTHERVVGFELTPSAHSIGIMSPQPLKANELAKLISPVFKRVTKEGKKAKEYSTIYEKGGKTTVEVTHPDSSITYKAEALCSLNDAFNRRLGNHICIARLQKKGVL